jgi:acyl carrier protein
MSLSNLTDPERELAELIVEVCQIIDPDLEGLSSDEPLFGPDSPFELDSLDAVEIMVALEKKYHIRIVSDEIGRRAFRSLGTLSEHITREREKDES